MSTAGIACNHGTGLEVFIGGRGSGRTGGEVVAVRMAGRTGVATVWKQKGDRADKQTWRGVTLLSVGTKVLARIVANRLSRWSNHWLHEAQTGFRAGRGADDVLQVSRRIAEEVARVDSDKAVLF
jgi:hypothetical protein